jgi:cytochrome P450
MDSRLSRWKPTTTDLDGSVVDAEVEYDPLKLYDDPYPIFHQLRDLAPVYLNHERGLWVLSLYADVLAAARDWRTYVNGRGVYVDVEDCRTD